MVRGPVGSLAEPAAPEEHEVLAGDGVQVYVHRDVLAGADSAGRISFTLGLLGRCRVTVG